MKKLLIFTILVLFSTYAQAYDSNGNEDCDGYDAKTSSVFYHTHCHNDKDTDTDTDTTKSKGSGGGVGTDIIVYQSSDQDDLLEEVYAEYRYDTVNKDHRIFGVFRLNVFKVVKNWFNNR